MLFLPEPFNFYNAQFFMISDALNLLCVAVAMLWFVQKYRSSLSFTSSGKLLQCLFF